MQSLCLFLCLPVVVWISWPYKHIRQMDGGLQEKNFPYAQCRNPWLERRKNYSCLYWGKSEGHLFCLVAPGCQLALCSFRLATSHAGFWPDKRQKKWWKAGRWLGSWLRGHIREWRAQTHGKRERKTWEINHREECGAGCALQDVLGNSNKDCSRTLQGARTTNPRWACCSWNTYFSGGAPLFPLPC